MKVLVTGSTGLVGTAAIRELTGGGHQVLRLVRTEPANDQEVRWDPAVGSLDVAGLRGIEGFVHLAGDNIAEGRWTDAKKQRIRDSRVIGTSLLARALAGLEPRPKVMVAASAIGYYGDRGSDVMTEESAPGDDFLANACVEWEQAARPAADADIRVVNLRIGVVLSRDGGALGKALLPFKLGVGGVIGSGEQYISWIAIRDLAGIIRHALEDAGMSGPVNAVAPNPVTNRTYTKTLGRVLHRPTFFPMPAFAARLAFGEMADALLLSSTRVHPERLKAAGFAFQHPDLEGAVRRAISD